MLNESGDGGYIPELDIQLVLQRTGQRDLTKYN